MQALNIADFNHPEVRFLGKYIHDPLLKIRRNNHFGILLDNSLGGCFINRLVYGDTAPESGDSVGHIGFNISINQRIGPGDTAGIIVLDDNHGGFIRKIAQNVERIVRIG